MSNLKNISINSTSQKPHRTLTTGWGQGWQRGVPLILPRRGSREECRLGGTRLQSVSEGLYSSKEKSDNSFVITDLTSRDWTFWKLRAFNSCERGFDSNLPSEHLGLISFVCSCLVKKNNSQLSSQLLQYSGRERFSQQEDIDISTSLVEKVKGGEVYFSQAYLSL